MKKMSKILTKYGPTALAVLASAGVVATAVFASKDAIKASNRIYTKKAQKTIDNNEVVPLTKKETFVAAAPAYIPTAIVGAATIACIIGSTVLSKKSQASLMSAYALVNTSYNQYRKAAKEVYGEDADKRIKQQIAIDNFDGDRAVFVNGATLTTGPVSEDTDEKVLFYEPYTKRYFWSTVRRVEEAEYHLNRMISIAGGISIGTFLEFLGLDVSDDSLYFTGWNADWILCNTCQSTWLDVNNIYTDDVQDKVDEDGNDIPSFYTICYMFDPILNYEDWDEFTTPW